MKYISLVSILILYSIAQGLTPSAQKILHGTVRDAQSGKPLPAANVQVIGKMRGTIANADGSYRLDIEQWPAAISASYIGYRSDTLHISSGTPEVLDIQLEPTLIHLEDLTITAENPAVAIMRRVIAGKRALRRQITSFRADAYSRLNAQNDTAIVLIMESQSHLYWQREKGTREVVLSRQQTENLRGIAASIGAGDIPNFYDDDINLAGYAFIGPTHPDALDFYEFELINRRAMDGEIVYDIALQPKTKLQPAFTGQLSVLDKKFVLLEVDVEDSGALPPQSFLQEIHLQCRQQFRLFGDGYWLPVDWHETGALRIGMTGLQFPTIKYVRLSSLDNYAVNIALPDSIFSDDRPRRVVAQVHTADSLLTLAHRTVPLTLEETLAYKKIDSTRTIDQ
ncbi:carboxypeptidase-like regulatory domain-containing protein, partial [candidate division KSB1 bacterium]|nr:carboxypeptidase-like regulatory domain-containing protein [candidate division KSB1 bacterium]